MSAFDKIDQQLDELKVKVVVPNYIDLLSRFKWSRKWFAQAEKVLLALAYRGESDLPIIEFIRNKIRDTDVLTFNDVLRNFNADPIVNHYQKILDFSSQCSHVRGNIRILSNDNIPIVDYVLKNRSKPLSEISDYLSSCKSNIAVDYLINNPNRIDYYYFQRNNNIKAIKYCMTERRREIHSCLDIDNNDLVSMYLLEAKRGGIHSTACQNPNDMMVDYLLLDPGKIDYGYLSLNTNDKIVEYLLANPDKIDYGCFSANSNNKAVEYLLANPDKIIYKYFSSNKNDRAVDHLLANPDKIVYTKLYYNNNDRAIGYLLQDRCHYITDLNCNSSNYNMQKFAAFNALKLFPRLPHLRI
jgi:hypothetical protein